MISPILIALSVAVATSPTIIQKSSGWCSPNIANVAGNVTVNCIGVDPQALKRLNTELAKKNILLADRIREANKWTAKYKELEAQLNQGSDDRALSGQAKEYLHQGELEKAAAILDQILAKEEESIQKEQNEVALKKAQAAPNYYSRGLVSELQFRPLDALPQLEKAYQYGPDNPLYGFAYAELLNSQNSYKLAEPIYQSVLSALRQLEQANPKKYLPLLAASLTGLGNLYVQTQRLEEAIDCYNESLKIDRDLAKDDPNNYSINVAGLDNDLGNVYASMRQGNQAMNAYMDALPIIRDLAKKQPQKYRPFLASALNNIGVLWVEVNQTKEAAATLTEALQIRRDLAKNNPTAYNPDLAGSLLGLGSLYSKTQQNEEATDADMQALQIYRDLAKTNFQVFGPRVALALTALGHQYSMTKQYKEAADAYTEAIGIYRDLVKSNPEAFRPDLALALANLSIVYRMEQQLPEAVDMLTQAQQIYRDLATTHPQKFLPYVAGNLEASSLLHIASKQPEEAASALTEAIQIWRDLGKTIPGIDQADLAYLPDLAMTLNSLGTLYTSEAKNTEAAPFCKEATDIYQSLATKFPDEYDSAVQHVCQPSR
jgi:tetratricopeptide (TPR) repeat protein